MVLLCGAVQAAHFKFDTPADLNLFIENINFIIGELKVKEDDKRQRYVEQDTRRNNMAKIKVSKWCQDLYFKIRHKAKMDIFVHGTSRPNGEALYFIRFRIMKPYKLHQTIIVTQEIMENIEDYLLRKYRNFNVAAITEGS